MERRATTQRNCLTHRRDILISRLSAWEPYAILIITDDGKTLIIVLFKTAAVAIAHIISVIGPDCTTVAVIDGII